MQTSNFAKYKGDQGVSIARWTPDWFTGRRFLKLAPPKELILWWKSNTSRHSDQLESAYLGWYFNEVLSGLDPAEVFRELGPDSVLLCYEKKGAFCHRRIVADWLHYHLGADIPEI